MLQLNAKFNHSNCCCLLSVQQERHKGFVRKARGWFVFQPHTLTSPVVRSAISPC